MKNTRLLYYARMLSLIINAVTVIILFKILPVTTASMIASILFIFIGFEIVALSIYLKEKISTFFSLIFFLVFALPIGAMRILIGGKEEIIAAGYGSILEILHFYSSKIFLFLILVCIYEVYKFEKSIKKI